MELLNVHIWAMISNVIRLKALVNIVVDRFKKKIRTVLADLYNYVHVDE